MTDEMPARGCSRGRHWGLSQDAGRRRVKRARLRGREAAAQGAGSGALHVAPIYAALPAEAQARVFEPAPAGARKVPPGPPGRVLPGGAVRQAVLGWALEWRELRAGDGHRLGHARALWRLTQRALASGPCQGVCRRESCTRHAGATRVPPARHPGQASTGAFRAPHA